MRLDRFVSQSLSVPRREVSAWIRRGRVSVNGAVVRDRMIHVVLSRDTVALDGEALRTPGHVTLVMNKPAGCISATASDTHETVLDHVPAALRHRKLAPIGRLDKDTTGLLLLTTDGGLSHYLTHPKHHVQKVYVATLKAPLPDGAEARFAEGVALADGTRCRRATLERLDGHRVRVTISEGRYHQVKRMIGALGGHVVALERVQIGALRLDPDLAPGEVRELSAAERAGLAASLPERRTRGTWDGAERHGEPPKRRRRRGRGREFADAPAARRCSDDGTPTPA